MKVVDLVIVFRGEVPLDAARLADAPRSFATYGSARTNASATPRSEPRTPAPVGRIGERPPSRSQEKLARILDAARWLTAHA